MFKNNCLKNNQETYPFFISNEFIDFSQSIWIFQFFYVYENIVLKKKLPEKTPQIYISRLEYRINVLPSYRIGEIKEMLDKKCNFTPRMNKIDAKAPWKFQFVSYFYLQYGWFFSDVCYITKYWNYDRIKLLAKSVYAKHP